jgi:tRNA-splicing ligase RtcB
MTVFYGSPEGLEEVRRDIEELGYKPSNVRVRVKRVERDGKLYITTEYSVAVSARSFKELLIALGAPRGRKVYEAYRVPGWLKRMPRWLKRLYLAALFGAELSKPQTINGYNFEPPLLSITKSVELEEAGLRFLEDIAGMLEELGVKVTGINKVVEGSGVRLRLQISTEPENLIKLWSTIGYEYNLEKRRLALAAVVWLKYKVSVLAERKAVEALAVALREAGFPKSQVVEVHVSDYVNGRFVERSLYEGRREEPRIAYNFPSFEEWVSSRLEGDIVWDEVEDVTTVPYDGLVYDITVDDEAHNFVAEGVVVSNCGVRVIRTDLTVKEVRPRIKELVDEIYRNVPSGVGSTGKVRLSVQELERVLNEGVEWALSRGYGWSDDIELIEQRGSWDLADANAVSRTAKQRGAEQLGTLGSGNHFLEVQVVDRVYDEEIAKVYGLFEGQIVVMIHTGSRGLGHQVASDYLVVMERAMRAYGTIPPDRELASVPWSSREAQSYFKAMAAAANFAWTNRQMIAHWTRESFKKVFHVDPDKIGMRIVYDVAHNIAKIEEYDVEGRRMKLVIHRKGATRAFPPGSLEIPVKYRSVGQPVLIPGSMGTASYILAGIPEGVKSWYTAPHGAGRWMSRAAAKRKRSFRDVVAELESKGIYIKASNIETVVEETPEAYKDVDKVAEVADAVGIAKLVARMRPIGVTKG